MNLNIDFDFESKVHFHWLWYILELDFVANYCECDRKDSKELKIEGPTANRVK